MAFSQAWGSFMDFSLISCRIFFLQGPKISPGIITGMMIGDCEDQIRLCSPQLLVGNVSFVLLFRMVTRGKENCV